MRLEMKGHIKEVGPSKNVLVADPYDPVGGQRPFALVIKARLTLNACAEGTSQSEIRDSLNIKKDRQGVEANEAANGDQKLSSVKQPKQSCNHVLVA